tara:strand:- start:26702 stop:27118 length:417 start_codon:yes stop_codon:yes gene_type:complete
MKKVLLFIVLLLLSTPAMSQEWINDKSFNEKINSQGGFGDSDNIIVVEFWAHFNKDNAFQEWNELASLDGVKYYRCDIALSPLMKKEYKVRMVPTILIFSGGSAYIKFKAKAGLDLLCPVDYPKMVRAIEVVKKESQY